MQFCTSRQINPFGPSVNNVLDFLTVLFHSGLGYSSMNLARSALSSFITLNGDTIGNNCLIRRFLKGVFQKRPALPKYAFTWDVSVVLSYLRTLVPVHSLSLEKLTWKLVMLLALLTGQRGQTLYALDIRNIVLENEQAVLRVGDLLKTTKPNNHLGELVLKAYPEKSLCVVLTLKSYMDRTRLLRGKTTRLFVTTVKPHNAAARSTLSRWIKKVMKAAGIDISRFTPHSTRSASTSAAVGKLPLDTILKTVGWKSDCTFRKFYNKPVVDKTLLGQAVMENS